MQNDGLCLFLIAYNGFGLGEGRELELQMFKISTNDR